MSRRATLITAAVLIGVATAGVVAGWWLAGDPHTATPERRIGTVTWSNQETRLIAFDADGATPNPLGDQTMYAVRAQEEANYPACLTGTAGDPVREDHRRVEVEAIEVDQGGPQKLHVAIAVHCLD